MDDFVNSNLSNGEADVGQSGIFKKSSPILASSPLLLSTVSARSLSSEDATIQINLKCSTTSSLESGIQPTASLAPILQTSEIPTSCGSRGFYYSSSSGSHHPSDYSFLMQHETLVIVLSSVLSSIIIVLIFLAILLILRYRHGKPSPYCLAHMEDQKKASWCRRNSENHEKPKLNELEGRTRTLSHVSKKNQTPMVNKTLPPPPGHTAATKNSDNIFPSMASNSRIRITNDDIPGPDLLLPQQLWRNLRRSKSEIRLDRAQKRKIICGFTPVEYHAANMSNGELRNHESPSLWNDPDEVRSLTSQYYTDCSSQNVSIFDEISMITSTIGGLSPRPATRS